MAPSLHRSEAIALKVLNSAASRVAIQIARDADGAYRPLSAGFEPVSEGVFLPLAMTLREAFRRRLRRDALAARSRKSRPRSADLFGRPPISSTATSAMRLFPQISGALLGVAKERPPTWLRQCGRAVALSERFGDRKGLLLGHPERPVPPPHCRARAAHQSGLCRHL